MADAIGNVRVSFTASAAGIRSAVDESVSAIGVMRESFVQSSSVQAQNAQVVASGAAAMREAAKIARDVRTPAEAYAATVAKLDAYLSRGLLTQEVYTRAVAKAKAQMDATTKAATGAVSVTQQIDNVSESASSAVNRIAESFRSVAASVDSVASAGSAVVRLGEQIAGVVGAWKLYKAATTSLSAPDGLLRIALGLSRTIAVIKVAEASFSAFGVDVSGVADVAMKASVAMALFKATGSAGISTAGIAAYAAQLNSTLGLSTAFGTVLTRLGVSAATQAAGFGVLSAGATALGGVLARLAAFSVPGFGQLAAAVYLTTKAFFSSRDAANETASSVAALTAEAAKLGTTFQDLQIQKALDAGRTRDEVAKLGLALSALDASHFDDLAFANERAAKSSADLKTALSAVGVSIASTFTGAFAGISDGLATFTAGFADIVSGVNAIVDPIAAALRPIGTLFGTLAQGVLQLVGTFASAAGAALRFGGVIVNLALSPFIVGLNNLADTIRSSVGAAFEYLGGKIAAIQSRITQFQNALAQLPLIGKAFASSQGGNVGKSEQTKPANDAAAQAAATAEAMKEAAKEEEQAQKSIADAIRSQESALSSAIEKSTQFGQAGFDAAVKYQQELRNLEAQLEAGILNETSFGEAARRAKADFDSQLKSIEERNRAAEDITKELQKSAKAGAELGAAADPIRSQFASAAEQIKKDMEAGLISPEAAKQRMGEAVDAMNAELKRMGEDQKFAEKIRDSLKTEVQKVQEELDAIDKNQTLTADEKEKAKSQVKDRFSGSLPGSDEKSAADKFREDQKKLTEAFDAGLISKDDFKSRQAKLKEDLAAALPGAAEKDAADKFREDQKKLKEAFDAGLIDKDEFKNRQAKLKEDLDSSVSDLRDKQERNKQSDRRAVSAVDVNSSEGASTFFRLLRGQDDPTKKQLEEMRKQTRLLERVAEAETEVVQI